MGEQLGSGTLRLSEARAEFGEGRVVLLATSEGREVGRGQMPEGLAFLIK